jgi:hypothetical protein
MLLPCSAEVAQRGAQNRSGILQIGQVLDWTNIIPNQHDSGLPPLCSEASTRLKIPQIIC